MSLFPQTVGVHCPRCKQLIRCALDVAPLTDPPPVPGEDPMAFPAEVRGIELTVPDLADRFAAHYRAAHPDTFALAVDQIRASRPWSPFANNGHLTKEVTGA